MTPITKQIEAIEKGARQAREVWLYNDDDYRSSEEVFIDYYRQEILNLITTLRTEVEGIEGSKFWPISRHEDEYIKRSYVLSLLDGKEE